MSEEGKQGNKRGRWLWVSGTVIAVTGFVLIVLPIVIEWGAEKWLRENGATQANIADIDLNLFTGRMAVYGLKAGVTEGRTLKVAVARLEINWQALFKRQIEVERIELTDAVIDVRPLSGKVPTGLAIGELAFFPVAASASKPEPENRNNNDWGIGIHAMVVNNVSINHFDSSLMNNHLQIKHLQLGMLASWLKDNPVKLVAELLVNGAYFHIDSELLPFQQSPQAVANIRLSSLSLKNYAAFIEPAGLFNPAGDIDFDLALEVGYKDNSELDLKLAGSVILNNFHAEFDDIVIGQEALNWQGKVSYLVNLTDSAASVLTSEGEVILNNLKINNKKSGLTLLDLSRAGFTQIKVAKPGDISVAEASLTQIQALKNTQLSDETVFVKLERILLNDITLSEIKHVAIDEVTLEQLAVDVEISRDGKIVLLDDLGKSSSGPAQKKSVAAEQKTEKSDFTFEIGQLNVTQNSVIKFVDNSVTPGYQMDMSPFRLTLKKINNAMPKQPVELSLDTGLGEYATFTLTGTLQPFAEKTSGQLKGNLKSLDLPPLSSYSGKYIGYYFQRGRLNTQFDIRIVEDKLDVNNTLVLNKLLLEEMDSETARGFSKKLGMPLNAALDLLRDSDDNIEFDLPVKGNLKDPEFELSGVIDLALTRSMQVAAMSYIKNALQPLGTIMLVSDIFGKVTALQFQPLIFDAGSAKFNDEGYVYLEKLATVLNERPKLQLTLCGISTLADQQVIEAQRKIVPENTEKKSSEKPADIRMVLLDLATQRGEHVKNYFITQKGISPERLFSCNAKFSDDKDVLPGVAISL